MGAFFTNVHVYGGEQGTRSVRTRVLEHLRGRLRRGGYVEVVTDDEPVDRAVLVGPAGPEPWIGVFDEATENQDQRTLDRLARSLSRALGTACVGVLLHDDDILVLRLFRHGRFADGYNSSPDYFSATARPRRRIGGRLEQWRDLLVPGATQEQLGAAFGMAVHARLAAGHQEILAAVARLVGWHPDYCQVGYEYLLQEDVVGPDDLARFTHLRFRSGSTPVDRPSAGGWLAEGPPALEPTVRYGILELALGEPIHGLAASGRNVGGPGIGLRLTISGGAVVRGLVDLTTAQFVYGMVPIGGNGVQPIGPTGQPIRPGWVDVPLQERTVDGEPVLSATCADYPLAAGVVDPSLGGSVPSPKRLAHVFRANSVHVNLLGAAARAGSGHLQLCLAPLENEQAGRMVVTALISVAEKR